MTGTDPILDFVFTFGSNQGLLANKFVTIRGTFGSSRELMVESFGTKWAFQYESQEAAGVQKWGLKELKI